MTFQKAVKTEAKIRLAIAGPSGSGKTYTALTLASALADGGKVAVIDTERGSASKYADIFPEFDVMELDTYHPDKFTQGIRDAQEAGYSVLVIDSLSHAWNGPGGLLEIVEAITKRSKSGNSFTAWGEATPIQNRLIDAITRSKMHIICTMRSKQEYVLETVNGKTAPRKVGMAPVQRADLEYEFDVFAEMDYENTLIIQKSRCPALSGAVIAKPDAKVANVLKTWLSGAPVPTLQSEAVYALLGKAKNRAKALGLATDKATWEALLQEATGEAIQEKDLTLQLVAKLNGHLTRVERDRASQGAA